MFCFTKYLSQSPFFEKFLKSEGVCSPCYYDSPYCDLPKCWKSGKIIFENNLTKISFRAIIYGSAGQAERSPGC